MSKVKIIDDKWRVNAFCNRIDEYDGYSCGVIATDNGFVRFVSTTDKYAYVMLEIIKDGVVYRRTYETDYSERYAVTLAKRFAKEIFEVNEK